MKKESFLSLMDSVEAPTIKLASLVPNDQLDSAPIPNTMLLRDLLFHLGTSPAFVARSLLSGEWRMGAVEMNAPKTVSKEELLEQIRAGHAAIRESYAGLSQQEYENRVTMTPWGTEGTIEELSLQVLYSHQLHHKMQLFMGLKALGIEVDTGVLYMGLEPGVMKA